MSEPDEQVEPRSDEVEAFWNVARFHAKLNTLPSYFGPTPLESVPPPAWSFGDDEGLADLLESGEATLVGDRADFADELPSFGALGIVCDAAGRPRALVATTGVEVTADAVSEELTVVWAATEER
jgi:uncharacterized protein YhfF